MSSLDQEIHEVVRDLILIAHSHPGAWYKREVAAALTLIDPLKNSHSQALFRRCNRAAMPATPQPTTTTSVLISASARIGVGGKPSS